MILFLFVLLLHPWIFAFDFLHLQQPQDHDGDPRLFLVAALPLQSQDSTESGARPLTQTLNDAARSLLREQRDSADRSHWVRNCPGYRQIAEQLCNFGFDRITRLFASRSCFDADYERSWCCPSTDPVSGKSTGGVVLPDCFIPDGFNSLTPELCRRWGSTSDGLSVSEPLQLVLWKTSGLGW